MTIRELAWPEGAVLSQQSFQQWQYDQFQRFYWLNRQTRFENYGVLSLELLPYKPGNIWLKIKQCEIMFNNGCLVNYSANQREALAIDIESFSADLPDSMPIYLAMPNNQYVSGLSGYKEVVDSGWVVDYQQVADSFDENRTAEVAFKHPNLRLVVDNNQPNWVYCQLLTLLKTQDNQYVLDNEFIPPCLAIGDCPRLVERIEELASLLISLLKQFEGKNSIFSPLLFQLIYADIAIIRLDKHQHPYQVWLRYLRLLVLLGIESESVADLVYDHCHLLETFTSVNQLLKDFFDQQIPQSDCSQSFHQQKTGRFVLDNIRFSAQGFAIYYLDVVLKEPMADWQVDFVNHVKLASKNQIDIVVSSALSGVEIKTDSAKIADQLQFCFKILSQGDYWQDVLSSRSLVLLAPDTFKLAQVRLVSKEA